MIKVKVASLKSSKSFCTCCTCFLLTWMTVTPWHCCHSLHVALDEVCLYTLVISLFWIHSCSLALWVCYKCNVDPLRVSCIRRPPTGTSGWVIKKILSHFAMLQNIWETIVWYRVNFTKLTATWRYSRVTLKKIHCWFKCNPCCHLAPPLFLHCLLHSIKLAKPWANSYPSAMKAAWQNAPSFSLFPFQHFFCCKFSLKAYIYANAVLKYCWKCIYFLLDATHNLSFNSHCRTRWKRKCII